MLLKKDMSLAEKQHLASRGGGYHADSRPFQGSRASDEPLIP